MAISDLYGVIDDPSKRVVPKTPAPVDAPKVVTADQFAPPTDIKSMYGGRAATPESLGILPPQPAYGPGMATPASLGIAPPLQAPTPSHDPLDAQRAALAMGFGAPTTVY